MTLRTNLTAIATTAVSIALAASGIAALASAAAHVRARATPPHGGYVPSGVLKPPAVAGGFGLVSDIVFFDSRSGRLYLGDDANGQVDVWNARSGRYLGAMKGGFTGLSGFPNSFDGLGPDGVLVDGLGQLWAGNGNGTVVVGRARPPFALIDTIKTGGKARADELAYDPVDRRVLVTNPSEVRGHSAAHPYLTLIDARPGHHRVIAHVAIPGAGLDSVEQPAWDPRLTAFVVSVRETRAHPKGELAVVDPVGRRLVRVLPLSRTCHPAGIAVGPTGASLGRAGHGLLLGCDGSAPLIVDDRSGATLASFTADHACCADEVWFDPSDGRYYAAESGSAHIPPAVMVIDARTRAFIANIPITDTSGAFHAVAAGYRRSLVFVPESDGVHVFRR